MAKKVYIIHGWDGTPEDPLFRWFETEFKKQGYEVTMPYMPEPSEPTIEAWVGKLNEIVKPDADTVLMGHSIGCQAVLRYLEALPEGVRAGKAVLIAPWMVLDMQTIQEEGEEVVDIARPWMETPIDFAKVRARVEKTIAIFSDDDPYVPLSQKDLFEKELGATIIVEHGLGHFSSGDGIKELPSALKAAGND